MSDLHHMCSFPRRPIDASYIEELNKYMKFGIPATFTIEQSNESEAGSNTTPLHIICRNVPKDCTEEEMEIVLELMNILFSYGAGWNFLDFEDKMIGDLLIERGFKNSKLYQRVVDAGVSAELLLRKVNDNVSFIDPEDMEHVEEMEEMAVEQPEVTEEQLNEIAEQVVNDPAQTPATYLATPLEYTDNGALVTQEQKDGVMMDWETNIMAKATETLFSRRNDENRDTYTVLNIGFGMGIIDSFIQEQKPHRHYISEAHPDVLAKMKADGWMDKENVVVLEGRWQDRLPELLSQGVFFNGIYYDTFSEDYNDMLDLYDLIVGLLDGEGVFSFFNGLGADRQLVYDVYKKIVELDMMNYGLSCEYEPVEVQKKSDTWDGIKRSYFEVDEFYHPVISFM